MTVLSHLKSVSSKAVLNGREKKAISTSINTLQQRLNRYFRAELIEHYRFCSSARGTILPREMDERSDIDYIVVFADKSYVPSTYLNKLKKFVNYYYSSSEVYQSSPTIVLNLNHIKFELVPSIIGFWGGYKIPAPASNYSDWIDTDPNDFNQGLINKNTRHN